MDFERFNEEFMKILPALFLALLILGVILWFGLFQKWQSEEERPSYVPAPTNVAPLAPELAPEPTEVAPLKPADIPKPTGVLPLGSEPERDGPSVEPSIPPPTGVEPL